MINASLHIGIQRRLGVSIHDTAADDRESRWIHDIQEDRRNRAIAARGILAYDEDGVAPGGHAGRVDDADHVLSLFIESAILGCHGVGNGGAIPGRRIYIVIGGGDILSRFGAILVVEMGVIHRGAQRHVDADAGFGDIHQHRAGLRPGGGQVRRA